MPFTQRLRERMKTSRAMLSRLADWERTHWEILKREYDLLMEEYRRHMGFEPF